MITIVSNKGKSDFPPGCTLEKTSVINFISYFMGLDPAYFVLSYKDQEDDVIALDTDEDYEALKHLRDNGMKHIEINIDWLPDKTTDAGEMEKAAALEAAKSTEDVPVLSTETKTEIKTEEKESKEPKQSKESKESKEAAKAERQKQKQLEKQQEKQKAQEALKKAREEKQLEAKLEKERKIKEKEEQQRLKKEAQAKEKEAKKEKQTKKAEGDDVKERKSEEKKEKSVEKEKPVKPEVKDFKQNSLIRTNTEKELHVCTGCEQSPVGLPFYRCIDCQRFSICEKCEAKSNHEHPLLKIRRVEDVPLLVVSVAVNEVEPRENEEEFVNELKNIAAHKLNSVHKNKVKSLRDEKAHQKQLEKEKEKEQARLQKEKEKAEQLKEKERIKAEKAEKAEAKDDKKKKKEEKKTEQPSEVEKPKEATA